MSIWDQIKNLFQSAEESSSNQPAIHEVINRSAEELVDFERWKESLGKKRLLDWLKAEHVNYIVSQENTDPAIDFLNTPSTKGFVVHFYKTNYNKREIIHFFDLLKEKVLDLGYKSYLSDTRTYNKQDWVEQLDRHYLKPPSNLRLAGKEKMDQRFGNITIELLYKNDKISLLKFRATVYSDHLYKEGEDFNELMKAVYFS